VDWRQLAFLLFRAPVALAGFRSVRFLFWLAPLLFPGEVVRSGFRLRFCFSFPGSLKQALYLHLLKQKYIIKISKSNVFILVKTHKILTGFINNC